MHNWEIQAWECEGHSSKVSWQVDGFSDVCTPNTHHGHLQFLDNSSHAILFIRKFFFSLQFSYQILFIPKPMSNRTKHANWSQWSHRNNFAHIR